MEDLTPKEQKVIQEFSKVRPDLGAIAERNIRNNDRTGWADIIAEMNEEDIKIKKDPEANMIILED